MVYVFRCNERKEYTEAAKTLVRSKRSSALYDQQLQVYIFFLFISNIIF